MGGNLVSGSLFITSFSYYSVYPNGLGEPIPRSPSLLRIDIPLPTLFRSFVSAPQP